MAKRGPAAFDFATAEAIRSAVAAGISRRALAFKHGVSRSTIDKLVQRQTYTALKKKPGRPQTEGLKRHQLADSVGGIRTARTRTLLLRLGVPRSELPDNAPFTRHPYAEYIGRLARDLYHSRMHSIHPDHGGNEVEAAKLNHVWAVLQARFAKLGINL